MKTIFYTNIVSPHQMPWCEEFVKLVGPDDFLYLAEESFHEERRALGWTEQHEEWIKFVGEESPAAIHKALLECDVLISTLRRFDLFAERNRRGLRTYYMFERWFKPPWGALRMIHPGYWRMCRAARRCFASPAMRLLPIGVYAVRDMARMCQPLLPANWRMEHRLMAAPPEWPGMRLWGYFVRETPESVSRRRPGMLRIFWCGRMLDWKRTETVVHAVKSLLQKQVAVSLLAAGQGPEEKHLRTIAGRFLTEDLDTPGIVFQPPMPIGKVREVMRAQDVYVLASDGGEGWGAVANEALNEGMILVGTYEAGSSATMLENGRNGFLYHAGNWRELEKVLCKIAEMKNTNADEVIRAAGRKTITEVWSPRLAAEKLAEDIAAWRSA